MKFPGYGIVVTEADLGTILEKGGEYADDPEFMHEAARLARQSLIERRSELREILDQPFGHGLLRKLEILDETPDDVSDDELSQMMHMLTRDDEDEEQDAEQAQASPMPAGQKEIILSYDYVMSIKAYVIEQIVVLERAIEEKGETWKLREKLENFRHYLRHIENYLEPVDVPDQKK